jgi:hypothetical protein
MERFSSNEYPQSSEERKPERPTTGLSVFSQCRNVASYHYYVKSFAVLPSEAVLGMLGTVSKSSVGTEWCVRLRFFPHVRFQNPSPSKPFIRSERGISNSSGELHSLFYQSSSIRDQSSALRFHRITSPYFVTRCISHSLSPPSSKTCTLY